MRGLSTRVCALTISVACGSRTSGPQRAPAEPPPVVLGAAVVDAPVSDAPPPSRVVCEPGTTLTAAPAPEPTWFCARADGTRHGPFITLFPDASTEIEGTYVDGLLDGAWRRMHPGGSIAEEGTYKAGHKDGVWRQLSANGATLGESTFVAGTGTERTWYESGALYRERALEASVPHGPARTYAPDGSVVIVARYDRGKLDGAHTFGTRGTMRFEETFDDGVRTGERKIWLLGVLIAEERFDRRGRLDGPYTLWRRARVMRAKGTFAHGVRTGPWTWWDRGGNKEREGRYVDGKRDGTWNEWWERKLSFTGTYRGGKPDGDIVYFDRAGAELGRVTIANGTGTFQTFHTNKKPSTKQALVSGLPSGPYQELTPLGKIVVEGRYLRGAKHGVWKKWTSAGTLVHEQTWKAGVLDGMLKKYVDGVLAMEATYVDGLAEGAYAEHRDGKRWVTGQFVGDKKDGTWTTYDRDGSVIAIATYADGVLHGPWRQLVDGVVVEGEMVAGRRQGTWTRTDRAGAVSTIRYASP